VSEVVASGALGNVKASSPTSIEKPSTPVSEDGNTKPNIPDINVESDEPSATPSKADGRKRAASPDDDDHEPVTPVRSTKRARTDKTPAKTPAKPPRKTPTKKTQEQRDEEAAEKARKKAEADAIKDAERAKKKADNDAKKAAAAAKKAAETQRKTDVKQWKENWDNWVISHEASERFVSIEQDCFTRTECQGEPFKLKKEDLECISQDTLPNPHSSKNPMNLHRYTNVVNLVYKKAAILGGVSQDEDDEVLVARGKEKWEAEKG
jgi:hypothetical protein